MPRRSSRSSCETVVVNRPEVQPKQPRTIPQRPPQQEDEHREGAAPSPQQKEEHREEGEHQEEGSGSSTAANADRAPARRRRSRGSVGAKKKKTGAWQAELSTSDRDRLAFLRAQYEQIDEVELRVKRKRRDSGLFRGSNVAGGKTTQVAAGAAAEPPAD